MKPDCRCRSLKRAAALVLPCAAAAIALQAQTFTTLVNFDSANGEHPMYVSLLQGFDGGLYGTASSGGPGNNGIVFKLTSLGTLTVLSSFNYSDGSSPNAGLFQASNGYLYGTAVNGGTGTSCAFGTPCGTVFKLSPGGTLTALHSLNFTDGANPYSPLIQATNGQFYGTTSTGGTAQCLFGVGCGTVFKMSPTGTFETLHNFDSTDGAYPYGGLLQTSNGILYGVTYQGGASNLGTVFKITPDGTFTTMYSFNNVDGASPWGSLIQGIDGYLYGTTAYSESGNGTVFKISPQGKLSVLHFFSGTDGASPHGSLVQGTDGNFYGTTSQGGANNFGTIFMIAPDGFLTTLHSFDVSDGLNPSGGLAQATDGEFYGTTTNGGLYGVGSVFRLSVGLGPFIKTVPTSGKIGCNVTILGTNLTGATSVTFNGTPVSTFAVNKSGYAITTSVPIGATTGKVKVVTPSATLSSNVVFRVR